MVGFFAHDAVSLAGKRLVAKVETILLNRANKFSLPRGNEDKKRMETTQKKPPPAGT